MKRRAYLDSKRKHHFGYDASTYKPQSNYSFNIEVADRTPLASHYTQETPHKPMAMMSVEELQEMIKGDYNHKVTKNKMVNNNKTIHLREAWNETLKLAKEIETAKLLMSETQNDILKYDNNMIHQSNIHMKNMREVICLYLIQVEAHKDDVKEGMKKESSNGKKLREELVKMKMKLKELEAKNDFLQKENEALLLKVQKNYAEPSTNSIEIDALIEEKNKAQEECNTLKEQLKLNKLKAERNTPQDDNMKQKHVEFEAKYTMLNKENNELVYYVE